MNFDWRRGTHFVGWGVFPLTTAIYTLDMRLICEAVAIGDTINPVLPQWLSISLNVLNAPMYAFWLPTVDWLKPYLTDNGVIELLAWLNAAFWANVLPRLFGLSAVRVPSPDAVAMRLLSAVASAP